MRKLLLISLLAVLLFLAPTEEVSLNRTNTEIFEPNSSVSRDNSIAEDSSEYIGTGDPLNIEYSGVATNKYDGSMTIDSTTGGITSVTVSDDWTRGALDVTIDDLKVWMNNTARNWNLDDYHNEYFLAASSAQDDEVAVPDSWTLIKSITGDGSTHPNHGTFELNENSGYGYSGTRGWNFKATWSSGTILESNDEIYLSQQVSVPWRELYSVQIRLKYYVESTSNLNDQVHLIIRLGGYEEKIHVFESGDTTDTWLTATVNVPSSYISTISMPNALLLDVGLATDLSGSQPSDQDAYVYVDNIEVNFHARPFPEQIGLKVNGTAVAGSTPSSIYQYLPDGENRDCYDDVTYGVDLDGYDWWSGSGDLSVGYYSSASLWTDSDPFQAGFQFPVNIPQGAAITSAWVEVEPSGSGTICDMRVYVAGFNTTGQPIESFTTGLPHLEDRYDWIDTSIDWDIIGWVSPVRIAQKTPDIGPIVQKIISNSSWSSGNHITVMLDFMHSSSAQNWIDLKGSAYSTYASHELARLFVEYLVPLPEDTVHTLQYHKDITIDHTKVADNLTDFPVLIDIIDTDLKTDVQADGDDIAFMIGSQSLDYEIELFDQDYSGSEAHLVAWVKVPYLSSTEDTVITMHYGNPNARSGSSTAVWDDYEVVHHMNEDPSGTIYDSTSNNHLGTAYGNMGSEDAVTGIIDGSMDFDGSGEQDVISIGQVDTDEWTSLTIGIWVRQHTVKDCRVFSKSPSTDGTQHIITIRISSSIFYVRIRTDSSGATYVTNKTLTLDTWHYLVWSWNASTGTILAYMDGQPALEQAHGGTSIYDSIEVFVLGNTDLTHDRYFNGTLDEARLTTMVLTEDWIDTEYANQLNPSSFYSVGTEVAAGDSEKTSLLFTTGLSSPVGLNTTMLLEYSGSGQTLDENLAEGTTFYAANDSICVNWTAKVLISPPAETHSIDVLINYPQTEWKPISVTNPIGTQKTEGVDWDYVAGVLTIYNDSIDVWGVWTIEFVSWNYMQDLQLGISGQALSSTATLDINDDLKLRATSPWIEGARVGLILTDPNDNEWYTSYNTTGTPGATWDIPSFRYRKELTILAAQVDADVTNFPILIDFNDNEFQDTSKVQSDGSDIVFVQNGLILAHEIERFTQGTGKLIAWVKANLSSSSTNTIYMYYGNPVVGSQENPTQVWTNGYEAVWHLNEIVTNEGFGEAHYDSTSNNYTGTHNGNSRTSGQINYAQDFDGDDWIVIDSTEGLAPSGDVTLSGWFYLSGPWSSTSSPSMMLMENYLDSDWNFHIALVGTDYSETNVPSGSLVFGFETLDGEFVKWTQTTSWSNGWYHYTCYMDADTPSNNKIYINGADDTNSSSAGSAPLLDLSYNTDWGIGGRYGDLSEFTGDGEAFLTGKMDEVRVSTGQRIVGWISTEYDNQNNPTTFTQRGSEVERTSPEHTFTKTINSTFSAGLWTATVYYNDTGSSVKNRTGIYERNFIVKHDTTLSLVSPGDAVGDHLSVKIAGDMLYVVVELTDDVNSAYVNGSTITMNWTIQGSSVDKTLVDWGNGTYSISLNTTDLVDARRWRLNLESNHQYYNMATTYFDLDLSHETHITYETPPSTPYGDDFTVKITLCDSFNGTRHDSAIITANRSFASAPIDHGNGTYTLILDSSGLSVGSYTYQINATPVESYLEATSIDITFTLRNIYTAIFTVGGNSINTPYNHDVSVNLTFNDADHGFTVITGASESIDVESGITVGVTEVLPGIYNVNIDPGVKPVGGYIIEITLSKSNYYSSTVILQLWVKPHDTYIIVEFDNYIPWGYDSHFIVTWYDVDESNAEITGSLDNVTIGAQSETSLSFDLDTDAWTVDEYKLNVIVYSSSTIYQRASTMVNFTIRAHFTTVTAVVDETTPWGYDTDLTVTFWDTDFDVPVPSANVSTIQYTPSGYSPQTPGNDYTPTLTTSSWDVEVVSTGISVTCVLSNKYYDAAANLFNITIRAHHTMVSVESGPVTPWGDNTSFTVVFWDIDNDSPVPIENVTSIQYSPTSYSPETPTPVSYTPTLTTDYWDVGVDSTTISVTCMDTNKYYDSATNSFDITIRAHLTSVTVNAEPTTPWGYDTQLTVLFWDADIAKQVPITNVTTNGISFDAGGLGTQTFDGDYSITLDTDTWDVQIVEIELAVACVNSNKYYRAESNFFNLTIRAHHTTITAVVGDTTPFGWQTPADVTFWDVDNDEQVPIANVTNIQFSTLSYGSQSPTPVSYSPTLTTKTWDVGIESTTITVTCASTNKYYDSISNIFDITIRAHHTIVTAVASSATPWGWNTSVIVTFWDTDNDTSIGIGSVDTIQFSTNDYGSQTPIKSYTPTLDTDSWIIDDVSTTVTVTCTDLNKYYDSASNSFYITIRAHHTLVSAIQDSTTPWGSSTPITVTFWDTDNDAEISLDNATNIIYTPSGESLPVQPPKSNNPTLTTGGWDVGVESVDISLTADSYYDSASSSFDITIRAHHTTITAVVANATPWGWDTDVTITFWDVDEDEQVPIANVTNIQFTPSGHSAQNFVIYTPILITSTWDVGLVTTGIMVTCEDTNKYYDFVSNSFNITIRAHHTTVTAVVTNTTPWGWDTDVTVTFWDVDEDEQVPIANVTSITYAPSGETLPSQPSLSYTPTLTTSGWDVGVISTNLFVSCIISNKYYDTASNSFVITIRAHHTTVTAVVNSTTPWGWDTDVTVTLWDTDDDIKVPITNVTSITYTPSGETLPSQPSKSYTPTLTTSGWDVGVISTDVSVICAGTNEYYDAASNSFAITIRAHHTTVTAVVNSTTPWGWDTDVTVILWDTDDDVQVPITNVTSITYTPIGETLPSQPSLSYTPTLTTSGWDVGVISTGISVVCAGTNECYHAASNSFAITIRAHHTTVTAVVNSTTPWGWNTNVTVTLWDTDDDIKVPIMNVTSITYTPIGETLPSQPSKSYTPTLTTSGWDIGVISTSISVVYAGTNEYYNTALNSFDITIRAHHTSVSVTGGMTVPYGNDTPINVIFWDTDNDEQVPIANVSTDGLSFDVTPYTPQYQTFNDYSLTLSTNDWDVGSSSVVLTVTCEDSNKYYGSATHTFQVTIRTLGTYLYHEPSDLRYPSGDNFTIILRVNTSESGNTYDGDPVLGLLETEFSIPGYTIWWINNSLGDGRYLLTINASYFGDDEYTITVKVQPNRDNQSDAQLVITFVFEPAQSFLSSPNYPQVTTPFDTDVQITLNYTDVDRGFLGISSADITAEGITIYGIVEGDPGEYTVWLNVLGLGEGYHYFDISADAAGYQKRTLYDFTVLIRIAFTYAIPTVGALDIPVGNDPVFYVEYWDIDHDVPVTGASVEHDWDHSLSVTYIGGEERYRVEFPTFEDDALRQNYVVNITFYKSNYQNGSFSLSITIRTHTTDFRLVSAVEPTSYDGIINISVYYGDVDNNIGIDSALYVYHRVENETQVVSSSRINETGGYYTIQITASQFGGLGLQNFTIYFNWTGPVYTYQNKTIVAAANIVGEQSKLTLIASAEPTPYLENMSYTILFSEFYSGQGIKNTSNTKYGDGHVFISVSFQDVLVDVSKVDIWETNYTHFPGYYSIRFNTSIFASITTSGPILMNLFINWSRYDEPFYTNRTDVISVRILARDTLISLIPPSPTPWGENATFSFTYDDVTGGASEPIAYNDAVMTIALSIGSYTLTYTDATKLFTISFDTSQSPVGDEPVGPKSFKLNVTWAGAPFYANRTGRTISITVTKRQTVVDFQSPAPTPYLDNVTFSVTWEDVTNGTAIGINGATVTLYNESVLLPSAYYNVTELPNGGYEIKLNTTYRNHPGKYNLKVGLTTGLYYMPNINATRSFTIQYRVTLLSSEPIQKVAYNESINAILYYQDLLTLNNIANDTTTFIKIINGTDWYFTCNWKEAFGYYEISIETYNHILEINTPYSLRLNITYVDISPFYRYDDLHITFELRSRYSQLELEEEPTSTPYLEYVNFSVLYTDVDGSYGIDSADLSVYKGVTLLTSGVDYLMSPESSGIYSLSVLTTVLDGLGITTVTVYANWTLGAPYHNNDTLEVDLNVIKRDARVQIIVQPAKTRYLENASFVFAFVDSLTEQNVALTKDLVQVYNHLTELPSKNFSWYHIGGFTYEISIDSEILSPTLVTSLNLTVVVNPALASPYYINDQTSTRLTITARDTLLSVARPTNTQYGENATFSFSFIDITGGLSDAIANSSEMAVVTTLSETPSVEYESATREFTISFNTEQFADVGQFSFYLNVTWAGIPFYSNKTLQLIYVTVIHRQTQADFEAPAPTPFGDNVNFTITYLDIAGQTSLGISDGSLTIYNETGFVIPGAFYDVTADGQGNWEVKFDTDYFNEPGLYLLNASFIYTGTYFSENATSTRFLKVQFRSTILSAEPVGQIGYATQMEVVLYFQDLLTLTNIGNLTSQTTLKITNDTGIPWVFSIQWYESTHNYILLVETAGQIPTVNCAYKLNVSISYKYMDPFYGSDWTYVEFYVRYRDTTLELQDAPLPMSYLEFVEFSLYYWDADIVAGVALADIELETNRTLVKDDEFLFSEGAVGVYIIKVNTSALYGLGSAQIKAKAIWTGGAPYYDDATLNVSVTVIQRPTNIEIISPPGLTRYQDNVTFTLSVVDITTDSIYYGQNLPLTKSDLEIWDEGELLDPSEFSLIEVGTLNEYDISIKSTILTNELRPKGDPIQLTLIVNWTDAVPYYKYDTVITTAIVTNRVGSVVTEPVEDTPKHDNMIVIFTYTDEDTGIGIEGAIISFYQLVDGDMIAGTDYWLERGSGVEAGNYTILVNTTSLLDIGTFTFTLSVKWSFLIEPFYKSPIVRQIRGAVRNIRTSLSNDPPSPSTVPINDYVSVNVTFIDEDHLIPILQAGNNISVAYKGGSEPQDWTWQAFPNGVYEITVRIMEFSNPGTKTLIMTFDKYPYDLAIIQASFQLRYRYGGISITKPSINYAGDPTYVLVNLTDSDANDAPLESATLVLNWDDDYIYEEVTGSPGLYNVSMNTTILGAGLEQLIIDVLLTDFTFQTYVVDVTLSEVLTEIQLKDEYTLYWGDTVEIYAIYYDTIHGVNVSEATVEYTWAGNPGTLSESSGNYTVALDSNQVTATTVIVNIRANKTNYRIATNQITLNIRPLPIKVIPIAYEGIYAVSLPRGESLNITVYLNDTHNNRPVENADVTVYWSFTQSNSSTIYEIGGGYYKYSIDTLEGDAGNVYTILITALKPDYQGSSTSLTLSITQTPTMVLKDVQTLKNEGLVFNWSQIIRISVYVIAPSLNGTNDYIQWNSTVKWSLQEETGNFTPDESELGHFYYDFDTSLYPYGTHTIKILATPTDAAYSSSNNRTSLTIQRVPTEVTEPPTVSRYWGWSGWFNFTYQDLFHNVGIDNESYNRNVEAIYFSDMGSGNAKYLGNGIYSVFINTTKVIPSSAQYSVRISLRKDDFENGNKAFNIYVRNIETEITAYSPQENQIAGDPYRLQVPWGDTIQVNMEYHSSESLTIEDTPFIGGIVGASGEGLIQGEGTESALGDPFPIGTLTGGNYSLIFHTSEWTVTDNAYTFTIRLSALNRTDSIVRFEIYVINIPTRFNIVRTDTPLYRGDTGYLEIEYIDTWPTHNEVLIPDATITANSTDDEVLRVITSGPVANQPGVYRVEYQAMSAFGAQITSAQINFFITKENSNMQSGRSGDINVEPTAADLLIVNATQYGSPILAIVFVIAILWARVFSVPKRLRQLNGQIKALRKGKIPKPIKEAKTRQQSVAELFNDTYTTLEIKRTADQMPPEAIEVDIPEMGELLMQLTILTNPTPEELEEFKADIAKMKLSEQAAFVKEVIHQEAIRAARRDGKTLDETLEWVRTEACSRLGAEAAPIPYGEEVTEEESVILLPEEEISEEEQVEEVTEEVEEPVEEEVVKPPSDRLSQYELEELQKDLEKRGVPPHEIDTIMQQAKTLPRDLVEELIKSLGGDKD